MSSYTATVRIYDGTDADRIFKAWMGAGWKKQDLLTQALLNLDGMQIQPNETDATLIQLRELAGDLKQITERLTTVGIVSIQDNQMVQDANDAEVPNKMRSALLGMKQQPMRIK